MLDTNKNHSSCAFAEQIVSYLYDEASFKEKTEFAAHLENCASCAGELSAFGFVRSSIQEWRSEEIFALEMPALEIPQFQTGKTIVSTETNSLSDKIRGLFSLSPKMAFGSVAFAALLICAGLAFVMLNFSNTNELAGNVNTDSKKEFAANVNNFKEETNPVNVPEKHEIVSPNKPVITKINSAKDASVKASNSSNGSLKVKPVNQKPNNTVATRGSEIKKNKSNNLQNLEAPKLSDLDEDEDKSLRLADLFDEIGTE